MRKIGISYTETNFRNYWNWFKPEELGEDIELLELSFQQNNSSDFQYCDGFVLTGGIDVLPELYGGAKDYPYRPETFLPERDEFEKEMYIYAQAHNIPVLGICRGMQYINILEGGTVFEDNGEQLNLVHKKGTEDKVHGLSLVAGSLLHLTAGIEKGTVNSAHHQRVHPDHLGANLMISAYSEGEQPIIEALEFKDKSNKAFMLAVQWHPERMQEKERNPLSQKIKEQFIKAIKESKK